MLTPERTVDRKVKEAVLAIRLEEQLSKQEILERYLNTVYFGNGAYGVQAAAETYFGTISADAHRSGEVGAARRADPEPARLRPAEAPDAGHASAATSPSAAWSSSGDIDRDARSRRSTPSRCPTELHRPLPPLIDYFVEEVKQRLLDDTRLGETPHERYNAVFKGGLQIHTTLEPEDAGRGPAGRQTASLPDTRAGSPPPLRPSSPRPARCGRSWAVPTSTGPKYNLATQGRRQPGPSFKVFVLVAALEAGYSPA